MKISIVIPAHNEEDNITNLIEKIEETLNLEHELLVVNDHSTDATAQLVDKLSKQYNNVSLVENKLDKGFANALKTGFNNTSGEAVIPVMADLCDDLSTIKKMLDKINRGYDIVCGSRYIKDGRKIGGPRIKGFFSRFVGISLHFLIKIPTRDISNSFKLYRKKVIENIHIESKGFEVSAEIPLKAYFLGYKITEIPTIWIDRKKGKSKFNVFKQGLHYLRLYLWAIFTYLFRKILEA